MGAGRWGALVLGGGSWAVGRWELGSWEVGVLGPGGGGQGPEQVGGTGTSESSQGRGRVRTMGAVVGVPRALGEGGGPRASPWSEPGAFREGQGRV